MKYAGNLLLLAGGALLVCCGVVWTGGALFAWYEARALEKVTNHRTADHRALRLEPLPHPVIGRLAIPRLRVSAVVVEGDDDAALRFGAGAAARAFTLTKPRNISASMLLGIARR